MKKTQVPEAPAPVVRVVTADELRAAFAPTVEPLQALAVGILIGVGLTIGWIAWANR